MNRFVQAGILVVLLLIAGCAPKAAERQRFFWPPGDARPRIEYLEFFYSDDDVRRGGEHWLAEAVLGKSQPHKVFSRPHAVAADGKGRVFVSDVAQREVFVLDRTAHQVRTLKIPNVPQPPFKFPGGLAVDDAGRLFVADSLEGKIIEFGADEKAVRGFGKGQLQRPTGLCFDNRLKRLYVVDTGAHQVVAFDGEGKSLGTFGRRGSGPGEFNFPLDVDVDSEGNLYVLDSMNARVQVLDPQGRFLREFGERGTALGSFRIPKALSISPSGHVYVTDSTANRFVIFDLQGQYLLSVGGEAQVTKGQVTPGGFFLPMGIEVDANEAIWVVDSLNAMIHKYQYLNDQYLQKHPIKQGQTFRPPGL
ncbi:hypothetical protein DESUT3_09990 [Desulfuromonas versatilis]|uniref:6-bladed beta-propeller n=1 Tax=Desulfuromonas versatilis TaxID=2802975 RepID=A0ABN6DV28_9BACT|nr:6-bladed beta-propeller [Desulfuromonas versatilis]BCR03930.1 hypothetical protein DESUT3_09990 [Desulfuromonas versatilis]